jgi:cell fate regulator YaaT (PSP1 superfamily)
METIVKEPSMFDLPEWTGALSPADETPDGQPRVVGVRFQRVGKVYHYNAQGLDGLKAGDWVIVDTARGRQMGQIATLKPLRDKNGGPYKRIERRATGRDMAMRHYFEGKELEAMIACRAESAALKLPIKIVRAEYSFDGQTLTFLYSSDQEERVEVGALRDAISRLYRARIEMRQISPREVAKILGGMGACGIEERCCSRFLTEFSPVSIKHAKEQNLSLNPHDITGMCGRLRCCLVYEYEQYVEARRHLPKLKSMIGTPMGEGKVVEILHLRDSVKVKIGQGSEAREVEFHREQLVPLEEYKRLQEKAASGACDKHENGECDCGRDGGRDGGRDKGSKSELPAAASAYIAANEAQQAEEKAKEQEQTQQDKLKARQHERAERRARFAALRRHPKPSTPSDIGRSASSGREPPGASADQSPTPKPTPKPDQPKRKPLLRRKPGSDQ